MLYNNEYNLNNSLPVSQGYNPYNPKQGKKYTYSFKKKQSSDYVKTTAIIGAFILGITALIFCAKGGKISKAGDTFSSGPQSTRVQNTANSATETTENLNGNTPKKGFFKRVKEFLSFKKKTNTEEIERINLLEENENAANKLETAAQDTPLKLTLNISEDTSTAKVVDDAAAATLQASEESIKKLDSIYNAKNLKEIKTQDLSTLVNDSMIQELPKNTDNISGLFRQNNGSDVNFFLFENGKQKIKLHLSCNQGTYSGWIDKGTTTLHFCNGELTQLTREIPQNNKLVDVMKKNLASTTLDYNKLTSENNEYLYSGEKANGFFKEKQISGNEILYYLINGRVVAKYEPSPEGDFLYTYGKGAYTYGFISSTTRTQEINLESPIFSTTLDKIKF